MEYNKDKTLAVHRWDWKAQPNWDKIIKAITDFQSRFGTVQICEVETGADENCIVLGSAFLTQDLANSAYSESYNGDW